MNKGELTKQRIVTTAAELFHERGMNVVSVGDILTASSTGKSQFYSHFQSRDDLVRSVLEFNENRICESFGSDIESWEELESFIKFHFKAQESYGFKRGCPFGTAAYALSPQQDEERVPLKGILDSLRDRLTSFFTKEKKNGKLSSKASPVRLSNFIIASVQGGMMISLIEKDGKALRDAIEECIAHLKSFQNK